MFTDRYRLKTLYAIGVLCATLLVSPSANAEVWRDDFDGERLSDAWKPLNDLGIWYVAYGFLLGRPANEWKVHPYNGLELTRFVDQREYFAITVTDLQVHTPTIPVIGFALGKRVPANDKSFHVYRFLTSEITASKINWREKPKPGDGPLIDWVPTPFAWAPKHPETEWPDTRHWLYQMTIRFNRGRFQFFANGKLRADFVDEHFDRIELIAITSTANQGGVGGVSVEWFSFSSPPLAVSPPGKLATSWAKVKGGF